MSTERLIERLNRENFPDRPEYTGYKNVLWHATSVQHIATVLAQNTLRPYTRHRYWEDGKRYKDTDAQYEDSFWMYGWSMTRSKEYAMSWNSVVIELDKDQISRSFEIQPISWNYLFKTLNTNYKKEQEEFVIAGRLKKSLTQLKQEDSTRFQRIDDLYESLYNSRDNIQNNLIKQEIEELEKIGTWMERWQQPHGKPMDISNILHGIYLDEFAIEAFGKDNNNIQSVVNHPLYKGTFRKRARVKVKI